MTEGAHPVAQVGLAAFRRWHRHEVHVDAPPPRRTTFIVGNHGFGTMGDPNVFALVCALEDARVTRPVTFLAHDLAFHAGVQVILRATGATPARPEAAIAAWAEGRNVVVFPGGDYDGGKSFRDRNTVSFHGRSGFARLAIAEKVPILPVVTAGAGEGALVLTDGRRLASALGLGRLVRYNVLPVSLTIPWGLSVGIAGAVPYLPLPTKLVTAVLPAMRARRGEDGAAFAARIEAAMQARMDELVEGRTLLLG